MEKFDAFQHDKHRLRCLKIKILTSVDMSALARPISIQHPRVRLARKIAPKKPIRSVRVQAALPSPDLVNYATFQLASWVLPMTIAGRLLKMEYPNIATGLVLIAVTKTALAANGIIHY